jgi:hypothetical protein
MFLRRRMAFDASCHRTQLTSSCNVVSIPGRGHIISIPGIHMNTCPGSEVHSTRSEEQTIPIGHFFCGSTNTMTPSAVTRAVRFMSSMQALRNSSNGTTGAVTENWAIYTPKHFPKFLLATSLISGVGGFFFMEYLRNSAVSRMNLDAVLP